MGSHSVSNATNSASESDQRRTEPAKHLPQLTQSVHMFAELPECVCITPIGLSETFVIQLFISYIVNNQNMIKMERVMVVF